MDKKLRIEMVRRILWVIQEKRPDADDNFKVKMVPMARRLEFHLYHEASDKASYLDNDTLKSRLSNIAVTLRNEKKKNLSKEEYAEWKKKLFEKREKNNKK